MESSIKLKMGIPSTYSFMNVFALVWMTCSGVRGDEKTVSSASPTNQSPWIPVNRDPDTSFLDDGCWQMFERNGHGLNQIVRFIKSRIEAGQHADTKVNANYPPELFKMWWGEWCPLRSCVYLYFAIYAGHVEFFNYLVEKGANVDVACFDCLRGEICFESPLLAVNLERTEFGNPLSIVKTLLVKGLNVDVKGQITGDTILHKIVRHGVKNRHSPIANETIDLANNILEREANLINVKNRDGDTPLLAALRTFIKDENDNIKSFVKPNGHFDKNDKTIAGFLLDHGADYSLKNNYGWTPLHYAILNCDLRNAIMLMMKRDVDVTTTLPDGRTVLHLVTCPELAKILIKKGAEVNAKQYNGNTPLHSALHRSNGLEMIRVLLLEKGSDPNAVNSAGDTPILIATRKSDPTTNDTLVKVLMEHGADINKRNRNNWTALLQAVDNCNLGMVRLLLSGNADVHARLRDGRTVLHLKVCEENMTKLLIDAGADVNAQQEDGQTPLHVLASGCREFITKKTAALAKWPIQEQGPDVSVKYIDDNSRLSRATSIANTCMRTLLEHGACVHSRTADNWTALHIAVDQQCAGIVESLLQFGADVKARLPDGRNVLHLAAEHDCTSENLTRLLLSTEGVEVNALTDDRSTPLLCAVTALSNVSENCITYVGLLLENGADPNAMNIAGDTPLLLAARYTMWWDGYFTYSSIAKGLLDRWAEVNVADNNTWTPLHYAVNNCNFDATEMLLERGADVNAKLGDGKTPLHLIPCGGNQSGLLREVRVLEIKKRKGFAKLRAVYIEHTCKEFHPGLSKCSDGMVRLKMRNAGSKDAKGFTQMIDEDLAELLIRFGANVNTSQNDGCTPLHRAVSNKHFWFAQFLINRGADVDANTDCAKETPLLTAVRIAMGLDTCCIPEVKTNTRSLNAAFFIEGIIKYLIARGADINAKGIDGNNALHVVIRCMVNEHFYESRNTSFIMEDFKLVEYLVMNGADVNAYDASGNTPLLLVTRTAKYGDDFQWRRAVVDILLNHGARVSAQDNNNNTALNYAIANCNPGIVWMLLNTDERERNIHVLNVTHCDDELSKGLNPPGGD